ncbi:helix-turn-helix domain-containing protein [Lactococcus petauri]|uniref:helix-turn-helix domain-containing protein n=1 Tax=Lactococcus petauri TaxID=1940789 RepID=UPI0022E19BC6|nr:helix-turn-helix domain-containing protein [Lactococcus petauri]
MSNRYPEALFSKDGVRKLLLLKLLYNSEEAVGIEELVFELGLDRRSIYKLIGELNDLIQSEKVVPEIEAIARGQYIFNGNKIDYFRLRGQIVNDEPLMNLAKKFLTSQDVDFSSFCTENFMSESTLRKYIRNANKLLDPLDLSVSIRKNKIRILGNEASIRYCLVSFLWRYFQGVSWPFKEVERETLDRFISSLTNVFEEISYGKRLQLTYYWAVFIQRAQIGCEISKAELPSYFEALVTNNEYFKDFSMNFALKYKLNPQEIKFAFFILYIFPESYRYIQNTSETLSVLKSESPQSYESIREFIVFVREKYPDFEIISEKRARFVAMLISGRIFVDTFKDIYFNSSALTIFTYSANNYPNFLPSIKKHIKKTSPHLSENTVKSLTLRYAQAYAAEFSPRDFEAKLLILLDTDFPLYVDVIMRKRLDHLLSPRFNYEWVSLKQKVLPDLLLATGPTDLRFSNVPKLFINAEVSEQDRKNILEKCEELVLQKKKQVT